MVEITSRMDKIFFFWGGDGVLVEIFQRGGC